MKIKNLRVCLWAILFLFSISNGFAQTPSVAAQAGFPVGVKNSLQVAYGSGRHVLLGGYNYTASLNSLYTSSTAASWSLVVPTNLVTTQFNNLAVGAGLFVVAGKRRTPLTSGDGSAWPTAGTVSASNGLATNRYNFVHANPSKEINFYRLLLQDADGKTTQSNVITHEAGNDKENITSPPNPVNDWFVIGTGSNLQGRLVLYDESGQAVKMATVECSTTVVNVSNLPAGIYRADVTQGGKTQQLTVHKR